MYNMTCVIVIQRKCRLAILMRNQPMLNDHNDVVRIMYYVCFVYKVLDLWVISTSHMVL